MGRLIDADKLKVYLQEYLGYGHAVHWVDAQPTAYDKDKVVKELGKWSSEVQVVSEVNGKIHRVKVVNAGKAMDLVRKGDVE